MASNTQGEAEDDTKDVEASEIVVGLVIGVAVLLFVLFICICFAWFIKCIVNGSYEREHRKQIVPTSDEEERKNAIVTNDNGEIHIFGRGSNRSNNSPYEYYVVMRPVNGKGEEKTVAKLSKKSEFDPATRPRGPLENWFMEAPQMASRNPKEKRLTEVALYNMADPSNREKQLENNSRASRSRIDLR